jgi:GNAT superfamily N-acetyltransferase
MGDHAAEMVSVVDIRDCPGHVAAVAGWVHREWWSRSAVSHEGLTEWVRGCVAGSGFPAVLVAVSEGQAIGSVFLHPTEAPDRPAYTPYVGALYVDAPHRSQGVGRALVRALEQHAAGLGYRALYLNAMPARTSFYQAIGWRVVETAYGPHGLNVMRRGEVPA